MVDVLVATVAFVGWAYAAVAVYGVALFFRRRAVRADERLSPAGAPSP